MNEPAFQIIRAEYTADGTRVIKELRLLSMSVDFYPLHPAWSIERVVQRGEPGWYVPADATHCPRCGDQNWDDSRLCLTCTHPDDPCSVAHTRPDDLRRLR